MRRKMSKRDWAVLLVFCIAVPFVFSNVTAYWRSLIGPLLTAPAPKSIVLGNALVVAMEVAGIGMVALIMAVPLTWLIPGRSFFLACCLALATVIGTLLPNLLMDTWLTNFLVSQSMIASQVIFFVLCWAVAALVNRLVNAREGRALGPPKML